MSDKKKISINGIKQNCYRLDIQPDFAKVDKRDDTVKTYLSLERKNMSNGYIEQVEEKDYPINAESITSYADGADYRRDPAAAIASAPKRVNLGDIREVQDFIKSDPQQAVRVFRNVLSQFSKADDETLKKILGKQSSNSVSSDAHSDNVQGGVE